MKNYFFLSFVLVLFFSCSSDDIGEEREAYFREAIIGSWSYETLKVDGQIHLYAHTENCRRDMFQFYNQEGKKYEFEEDVVMNCNNCAPCAVTSTGLNWKLQGNIVRLYFGEQFVTKLQLLEVTESYMIYTINIDIDEDGDKELVEVNAIYHDPYDDFN